MLWKNFADGVPNRKKSILQQKDAFLYVVMYLSAYRPKAFSADSGRLGASTLNHFL